MNSAIDLLGKNFFSIDFKFNSKKEYTKYTFMYDEKFCYLKVMPIHERYMTFKFTVTFSEDCELTEMNNVELFIYFVYYDESGTYKSTFTKLEQQRDNKRVFTKSFEKMNIRNDSFTLYYKSNFNQTSLSKDMAQLFTSKTNCDLKVNVGNKSIDVHKSILAARSVVFAKMIECDMLEKKTNTITIQHDDECIVEELLRFVYTDACDVAKDPFELFKLAHLFEISELQRLCEKFLMLNMNTENIINICQLIINDQYQLRNLKNATKEYVHQHKEILEIEENKEYFLANPSLLLEFLMNKTND